MITVPSYDVGPPTGTGLLPPCVRKACFLLQKCGKTAIKMQCQACGCSHLLDMKHKLATYMLRNPPDTPPEGAGGKK